MNLILIIEPRLKIRYVICIVLLKHRLKQYKELKQENHRLEDEIKIINVGRGNTTGCLESSRNKKKLIPQPKMAEGFFAY